MRNYLSVCGIFKNEAENLEEWLRFYELVGAEQPLVGFVVRLVVREVRLR